MLMCLCGFCRVPTPRNGAFRHPYPYVDVGFWCVVCLEIFHMVTRLDSLSNICSYSFPSVGLAPEHLVVFISALATRADRVML